MCVGKSVCFRIFKFLLDRTVVMSEQTQTRSEEARLVDVQVTIWATVADQHKYALGNVRPIIAVSNPL